MELGEKLRQARLEAGLSQRALCDGIITRNMLSQIENGTARPSVATLERLAERLHKPVSCFFREEASPNQVLMEQLRRAYDCREFDKGVALLEQYRGPDRLLDREKTLLEALLRLGLAETLLESGRAPYAGNILEHTDTQGLYCAEALEGRRLELLCRLRPVELPSLDEGLLLRGEQALEAGRFTRAARLLDAVEAQTGPRWNYLRGRVYLEEGACEQAAACLEAAQEACPAETWPLLERCYRQLGDYRRAYEYACKRRT